jgi:hypothetical protein
MANVITGAQASLQYSNGTIEAVRGYKAPVNKLPGVVVSQTIPVGTQVKKGETVGVSLVSPSDVSLGDIVIANYEVPIAIKGRTVGDIIDLGKSDQVTEILKNPSDPVRQQSYIALVNQKLGTNFGIGDVPSLLTLQKTYNTF